MKTILLLFMMLIFSFGNAQINVNEGFESGALPSGWFSFGGGVVSSTTPISGSQSVFFSNTTSASGVKDLLTADYTSTGNAINISFLSKEIGVAFVIYEVLYKINNTSAVSLGFETRASSAVPINNTYTIPAGTIPAGSLVDVTIRVGVMSGLTEFFVDDVVITQAALAAAVPTISTPFVSSITTSSAIFNYTLNANNAATTSIIRYGIDASALNLQVTGHSATGGTNVSGSTPITGLLPNTQYFFSIEATNSEGTTFGSGSFQTLAAPQLIANYTFDNTLNDVNGTNAFASQPGMTYGTDRLNIANKALFINGTGTTVSLANLPVGNSSRTFSLWIKPTQFNGANRILSYGMPTTNLAYGISFDANKIYNFNWESNVFFTQTPVLNVWKHIVCTYEQTTSTVSIYINGISVASIPYFSMNTANNGILYLGSLFGETGSTYIGYVDDLQIYNYALSQAEVTSLYTNNTLSSSDFSQNNLEVALYPNPVNDLLNIETALELQSVEIYNIQGQKVLSSNQKQINVSDLASGMYMVRIQDAENNIATKKIVIK